MRKIWDKNKTLKLLFLGNSFADDSGLLLHEVLKNLGVKFKLGILFIGGCSLATHLDNLENDSPLYEYRTNTGEEWETAYNHTAKDAILSEDWDIITFQQASYDSGVADTYDGLAKILPIVRSYNQTAKFLWLMTWAYPNGSPHGGFVKYDNNQATMYESIVSAVQKKIVQRPEIDYVIPVGTAIQNARTSCFGDTLNRDNCHLSLDVGRYIAATCVAYSLGVEIDECKFVPNDTPQNTKEIAIESVKNAWDKPFDITPSKYV